MAGPFDALGFVRSRLLRHSAEHAPPFDLAATPQAGVVIFAGDRVVMGAGEPGTVLLDRDQAAAAGPARMTLPIGTLDGRPIFALAIAPEAAETLPEDVFRTRDLRGLAAKGDVPADELGLLAAAKSLLAWHARHGFCANCGTATEIGASGFKRKCAACGTQHFPRTDPVAIMLVRRDERCLLGRAPQFPEGMYSCLAGFVEPGETIEDAVRRETREETGITVGAVRYRASQPWPFPSSLMIGCVAQGESEAIVPDPAELADARWFGRDELRAMFENRHPDGLFLPPPMAIAHALVREFADEPE